MGVKEEEGTEKHFRLNAIHIRGTEDMSTQDIFDYFKDYGPAAIEWINDYSCKLNVYILTFYGQSQDELLEKGILIRGYP